MSSPCAECPWRTSNHSRPHPHHFNTKRNLTRLWRGISTGNPMSCHKTDPSMPEHGAKPGSITRECTGSVILVLRELNKMMGKPGVVDDAGIRRYFGEGRGRFTKAGICFWAIGRMLFAGLPRFGGDPLPEVDLNDPTVSLPRYLE